jgi:hypothetical protein
VLKVGGVIVLYVPHPDLYLGHNQNHRHPGFTVDQMIEFLRSPIPAESSCEILEAWAHDIPRETHPCHSTLVVGRKR